MDTRTFAIKLLKSLANDLEFSAEQYENDAAYTLHEAEFQRWHGMADGFRVAVAKLRSEAASLAGGRQL